MQQDNNFKAEVVLFEPEIPQNTGNIARTCAALGAPLHLIKPLGFSLEDRYLRRAGLDYWPYVEVICHKNLDAFFDQCESRSFFFFTKKTKQSFQTAKFQGHVILIFGSETSGLPGELLAKYSDDCYRFPMREEVRSLNLSNTVAIALYEAFRQNNFPGVS